MDRFKFITDFPTEILEKIFEHFDDTTSTLAAGVCKRFNDVLNHTVRRKYNGSSQNKWYEMEIFDWSMENDRHEILQHHPFILKRVSAIQLSFHTELNNQPHWIHQVLGTIGRNVKMIRLKNPKINEHTGLNFYNILSKTPNMSHLYVDCIYPTNKRWCHRRYKKLTHLDMHLRTLVFDDGELKPFVRNNNQLKNVKLQITDFRVLYAFHKSKIESLCCSLSPFFSKDIPVNIRPIQMTNLKTLSLDVPKGALNECIEKIVAPCRNLTDLCLLHVDNAGDILTDQSMDILCKFRSMEKFEPFFYISLQNIVRLIAALPTLVSISLCYETFTSGDYNVLLQEANKHKNLRHIHFQLHESYEESLLRWLMENVKNQVQLDYSWYKTLSITKGKVRYNGVQIMSSDGSPIEYAKMTPDWLQQVQISATFSDQCYEFFSNLPIPIIQACFDVSKDSDLHLRDGTNEAVVRRRGKYITTATTTLSANNEKSVDHINWLEKYCCRLEQLDIYIEENQPYLPSWTFSELNRLRVHCRHSQPSLDLLLFASLKCLKLNCFKLVGWRPIMLANIQIVRDLDLFDNLVTLQIFHFNESTDQLLEQFNQNVQNNLRNLTLANRRVDGSRYKMNNKTITAISRFTNLFQLKLILPGINDTNTKYLFENCTKLSELSFECNFLSATDSRFDSNRMFSDIKANCISLKRLQLVWHDRMMDPYRVNGIKDTFPNVVVKIMQVNERMTTTAEQIVRKRNDGLERLFDEIEV